MSPNAPSRMLISVIKVYRYVLSPLMGAGKCRFYPTCSAYMVEAVKKHGSLRGGWLGARRFCNCHSFSRRPFHDPVPEAIKPVVQTSCEAKTRE